MDKATLIVMCGLPASGKSTQSKILSEKFNAKIHASDEIRKELNITEETKESNAEVFQLLHSRIKNDLKNGNNVIWDSTNINYKRRINFLKELGKIDCEKICYFMATPYEDCVKYNNKRENGVPEHVIKRMYKSIYIPQYFEGWDNIRIVWNFKENDFNVWSLFEELDYISQDNPHHSLTIGEHCRECCKNIGPDGKDNLLLAALLHDSGKAVCKDFKNSKGEVTEHAHFFQHHLVSAYMALFYLKGEHGIANDEILEICKLITWHMQPHFIETDKQINKYKKLLGEEFWNDLMILHEADTKAKNKN